jgi:hypothetical protein
MSARGPTLVGAAHLLLTDADDLLTDADDLLTDADDLLTDADDAPESAAGLYGNVRFCLRGRFSVTGADRDSKMILDAELVGGGL